MGEQLWNCEGCESKLHMGTARFKFELGFAARKSKLASRHDTPVCRVW